MEKAILPMVTEEVAWGIVKIEELGFRPSAGDLQGFRILLSDDGRTPFAACPECLDAMVGLIDI